MVSSLFPLTYFKRLVVSRKYLGSPGHNVEPATPVLHLFQQAPEILKVQIFICKQERGQKYSMHKHLYKYLGFVDCGVCHTSIASFSPAAGTRNIQCKNIWGCGGTIMWGYSVELLQCEASQGSFASVSPLLPGTRILFGNILRKYFCITTLKDFDHKFERSQTVIRRKMSAIKYCQKPCPADQFWQFCWPPSESESMKMERKFLSHKTEAS